MYPGSPEVRKKRTRFHVDIYGEPDVIRFQECSETAQGGAEGHRVESGLFTIVYVDSPFKSV